MICSRCLEDISFDKLYYTSRDKVICKLCYLKLKLVKIRREITTEELKQSRKHERCNLILKSKGEEMKMARELTTKISIRITSTQKEKMDVLFSDKDYNPHAQVKRLIHIFDEKELTQ